MFSTTCTRVLGRVLDRWIFSLDTLIQRGETRSAEPPNVYSSGLFFCVSGLLLGFLSLLGMSLPHPLTLLLFQASGISYFRTTPFIPHITGPNMPFL